MAATTLANALKAWESKTNGASAKEAETIKLCAIQPPMAKLDTKTLSTLSSCQTLSLSTNAIDKLPSLSGMTSLRTLSVGRNNLKKVEKLDDVATTLEQLWMSYNQVASLEGLACLRELEVLYCSNNLIKSFGELDHLAGLPKLREVLFVGNPMYGEVDNPRLHIIKRLPQVKKVDGELVKPAEIEAAKALEG